eukprot:jgi/Mesen1/4716/ME000241S03756
MASLLIQGCLLRPSEAAVPCLSKPSTDFAGVLTGSVCTFRPFANRCIVRCSSEPTTRTRLGPIQLVPGKNEQRFIKPVHQAVNDGPSPPVEGESSPTSRIGLGPGHRKKGPTSRCSEKQPISERHISRRRLFAAASAIASCSCSLCPTLGEARADSGIWGYGEYSGPPEWGGVCAVGETQSPINIPLEGALFGVDTLGPLDFTYESSRPSFLNGGHGTMQVSFPGGRNFLDIGGRRLELVQFHFHAPSEHSFGDLRSAMECHLVHKDEQGNLAVVGILMEGVPTGEPNQCLQKALQYSPLKHGDKRDYKEICAANSVKACDTVGMNPIDLLPAVDPLVGSRSYVHYKGSLTTPPCSEGVDWFLMAAPIEVSDAQVMQFLRFAGDGVTLSFCSRPIQALGERRLFLGP